MVSLSWYKEEQKNRWMLFTVWGYGQFSCHACYDILQCQRQVTVTISPKSRPHNELSDLRIFAYQCKVWCVSRGDIFFYFKYSILYCISLKSLFGEGNGNPLQYSCLENPMDRGAWQAAVQGVARVRHNLATKPPPPKSLLNFVTILLLFYVLVFLAVRLMGS